MKIIALLHYFVQNGGDDDTLKSSRCMQGVQDQIDALAASLSKSLKKELQESDAICQAQVAELCSQLQDRKAQITAKTELYQKVSLLLPCLIVVAFGNAAALLAALDLSQLQVNVTEASKFRAQAQNRTVC